MATLTSILASDIVSSSRGVINNNFQNLNADKYVAFKSTSTSVISNAFVADSELLFPVAANENWAFRAFISASTAAAPDFKYSFSAPSGATYQFFSGADATLYGTQNATGSIVSLGGGAALVGDSIGAVVKNSSTPGNVNLVWGQNTNTPSSVTTLLTGSYIIADKLP